MIWGDEQDADLHGYFRNLIRFRRRHPVLWRGRRETTHVDGANGLWVYAISSDEETITVALNASDEQRVLSANGQKFQLAPWSGDVRIS
jgi:glycosidase